MDQVKLQYEDGKTPPVKIKKDRSRPNSALTYIRALLAEGFRGNQFYYRDNDRRLILKVWEREGLVLDAFQRRKFLNEVTFPDSITRARRELRAEFPDSPAVQEKRFHLFVANKNDTKGGRIKRLLRSA